MGSEPCSEVRVTAVLRQSCASSGQRQAAAGRPFRLLTGWLIELCKIVPHAVLEADLACALGLVRAVDLDGNRLATHLTAHAQDRLALTARVGLLPDVPHHGARQPDKVGRRVAMCCEPSLPRGKI